MTLFPKSRVWFTEKKPTPPLYPPTLFHLYECFLHPTHYQKHTFILMPNKTFMGTHFYNSFPEDGKTLKAKLFIKMLREKHVSFTPEHSQMLSLLTAILTTKVNSSKGYLPAKFKSNNHILAAILGIQIPSQLWKSYPQSSFNVQFKHLQIQPWSTFSRRPPSLMLLKCYDSLPTCHISSTTMLQKSSVSSYSPVFRVIHSL